jgi:hypothetical protein
VNRNYLGSARNVARYRTQAEAGRRVLQWLAAQSEPDLSPDDADLAQAVEQWLAVGGVPGESIEQSAQPGESPTMTSQRIDLPAIAQDLLSALGLTVTGGAGNSGSAGEAAERLHGIVALFHGAAGSGRTLAAHVLAQALRRDILRIDLAQMVSKYIGETEKELDELFERAEQTNAILFFDEADALFGRRAELRGSHERHVNVDIAYLLERIAAHEGIVILATNRPNEIDEADFGGNWPRRHRKRVSFPRRRN